MTSTPERPCPSCGRPALAETRPFCSRRCADLDLRRWLTGAYAIPGDEDEGPGGYGEAGQGAGPTV